MMKQVLFPIWVVLGLALMGCISSSSPTSQTAKNYDPSLIADHEPGEPISVGEARQSAQHDQPIYIAGRIGGTAQPFVKGLAAFTLVDLSIPDCCGDDCTTPECSPEELANHIATVKFVDSNGKPLTTDARQLLNVKEKDSVVVQGRVQRDQHGNLAVLADKIFIRPGS